MPAPEDCTRCIWGCPWNGSFGCSHADHTGQILSPTPPCAGKHFRESAPYRVPPVVAEDVQ